MKLKDFIEEFSHNNVVAIENKFGVIIKIPCIVYSTADGGVVNDYEMMDWQLQYTNISDCEVFRIKQTYNRDIKKEMLVIVVDTDEMLIAFVPNKVTLNNCRVWLYDKIHGTNHIQNGEPSI